MEIAKVLFTCFFSGSPEHIRTYYMSLERYFLRRLQCRWNNRKQCSIDGDIQEISLTNMIHGGE